MNIPSLYGNRVFWTATSAVNQYPGGIGYANRVEGTDGVVGDLWDKFTGSPVGQVVLPGVKDLVSGIMSKVWVKTKEAAGYKIDGPVVVDGVAYVKARTPTGIPVLINEAGVDSPYTPEKESKALKYDPVTGRFTPMAVGIGIGVVAIAVIAAFFLLRRR